MKRRGVVEIKPAVQYSESFKRQVVRELEAGGVTFRGLMRKYGIGGASTLRRWAGKYGNGTIGKVIRVETPKERDEQAELKRRIRQLEAALADTTVDLALERQYLRIACERAGIRDVGEFKKKNGGKLRTGP